jgi:adenylosuccinate lyase
MIELADRGMGRQEAHERLRRASMRALREEKPLADILADDPEVVRYCTPAELAVLLSPEQYIGTAVRQVEKVVQKLSSICAS